MGNNGVTYGNRFLRLTTRRDRLAIEVFGPAFGIDSIFAPLLRSRGWARYDLAKPETLRLTPPDHIRPTLMRDYKEMRIMIYGELRLSIN